MALAFAGLQTVEWAARRWARSESPRVRYVCAALAKTGRYGDDPRRPDRNIWLTQCAAWLAIIVLVKIALGLIMMILRPTLTYIADNIFLKLRMASGWKAELTIVMVLCPLGMNMVQFWIQDTFLKADKRRRGPRRCCACCRARKRDAYDPANDFGLAAALTETGGGGVGNSGNGGGGGGRSAAGAAKKVSELEVIARSAAVVDATRSLEDGAARQPPPSPVREPRRSSDSSLGESLLTSGSKQQATAASDLNVI